MIPYIVVQVLGGILAAAILYVIASGAEGFSLSAGVTANGYGAHSSGGYSLLSCLVCEVVMTLMFLFVIMGATGKRVPAGFAPIPIGLVLTLIHLISILVTNTSANPARSTGPAACDPLFAQLGGLAPISSDRTVAKCLKQFEFPPPAGLQSLCNGLLSVQEVRSEVSALPAAFPRRHESWGREACFLHAEPRLVERPDC